MSISKHAHIWLYMISHLLHLLCSLIYLRRLKLELCILYMHMQLKYIITIISNITTKAGNYICTSLILLSFYITYCYKSVWSIHYFVNYIVWLVAVVLFQAIQNDRWVLIKVCCCLLSQYSQLQHEFLKLVLIRHYLKMFWHFQCQLQGYILSNAKETSSMLYSMILYNYRKKLKSLMKQSYIQNNIILYE
jgi:hypothetical protein